MDLDTEQSPYAAILYQVIGPVKYNIAFVFDGPFPKRPFGDDGLTQKLLFYALSRALEHFEIAARLVVGQILPETAASALGLAAVREGEDDNLAHWVAFIGKDHLNDLNGTGIACESDWKGIVLDSDREYERWWVGRDLMNPLI